MAGNRYTDLPDGAVVEPAPVAPYADLPEGAVIEVDPEEGLTGTVTDESSRAITGPAEGRDAVLAGLRELSAKRASAQDIRSYLDERGFSPTEDTSKWLDSGYGERLAGLGPQDDASMDWSFYEKPEVGALEAAAKGMLSGAARGWDDEILSGLTAPIASAVNGRSIADNYREMADRYRARKQAAFDDHMLSYGLGFLPGAAAGLGKVGGAQTTLGKLAQYAGLGAAEGAASGAGNADGEDVLSSGFSGALVGGPLGALAYPLSSVAQNVFGRLASRFIPGTEDSGLRWLGAVAPQDANAMRMRADELAQAGVPARMMDIVDESGRGAMRSAASRMTPAREEFARHADQVYSGAQDRVVEQARNNISSAPYTARQAADATTSLRNDDMETAMVPLRAVPIEITDRMLEILGTREGKAALRGAEGFMTSADDRAAVRKVMAAVNEMAKLDPRLPPKVRQQIGQKLMDDANFTVDMADKFARAMKGRAAKTPGLERVATEFSDVIRGEARAVSPEYDEALNNYAGASSVIDNLTGDTSFLRTPADQYANATGAAATTPPVGTGLSEADAMRLRARDEIVDAATSGSGAGAGRVARQVAFGGGETGAGQRARNVALLGEEGANRLEAGMRGEVERVANARYVDPRSGSQTQGREQDAAVSAFIDAAANTASGGKWTWVREVARYLRQGGIRGVDAERLTRDAMSSDPARIRAAITYLEQRGASTENASRIVNTLAAKSAGRASGAVQSKNRREPPNSVRALYQGGR